MALALAAAASPAGAQEFRPVELAYAAQRLPGGGTAHDGEDVRVRGVVSVDSRAFYGELLKFYLQDGDAGLCVFSRKLRAELLSIDGATLIFDDGNVFAVGAILKVPGGSTSGGRKAAAMTLAEHGIGIKVSNDGHITAWSRRAEDGQTLFEIG